MSSGLAFCIPSRGDIDAGGQGLVIRTSFGLKKVQGEMVQVSDSRTESMPKEEAASAGVPGMLKRSCPEIKRKKLP